MEKFDENKEYKVLIDFYKKAIDIINEVNEDSLLAVEIVRIIAKNNPDILFSNYIDAKHLINLDETE